MSFEPMAACTACSKTFCLDQRGLLLARLLFGQRSLGVAWAEARNDLAKAEGEGSYARSMATQFRTRTELPGLEEATIHHSTGFAEHSEPTIAHT